MRHRRRYMAFEAVSGADKQDVYRVAASMCKMIGVDRAEVRVITHDADSRKGLLRCSHDLVGELKGVMAHGESPLKVLGVSGTIRAAKRKFLS
ncbi:MAG: hypothetical protein ABH852_03060 [Methanobacteriota archaeon]